METTNIRSIKNPSMTLITKKQMKQLLQNGADSEIPVVKLFMGPLTWLVTGIEDDVLYGYGEFTQGCVEFGSLTYISELPKIRFAYGYLERDRYYTPNKELKLKDYCEMETLTGI